MRWHAANHLLKATVVTEQHDVTHHKHTAVSICSWEYSERWLLSSPHSFTFPQYTLTSSPPFPLRPGSHGNPPTFHLSGLTVYGREEWLAMINGDTASEPLHVTALSDGLPYSLFVSPSFSPSLFFPHYLSYNPSFSDFICFFFYPPPTQYLFFCSHFLTFFTISSSRHISSHHLSLYILSPSLFLPFFTSLCCHAVAVQRPAAIVGQSEECQHHLSETRHQLSLSWQRQV